MPVIFASTDLLNNDDVNDIVKYSFDIALFAFCAAERTPVRLPADTRRQQRTAL